MSIDNYFIQKDGKWVPVDGCDIQHETNRSVGHCAGNFQTDFWVDISHGRNIIVDERYYFDDLASAFDFYLEGWRRRQFIDDDGNGVGLDKKGLYSEERLIHGHSIYGDAARPEGENLRQIWEALAWKMNQEKTI